MKNIPHAIQLTPYYIRKYKHDTHVLAGTSSSRRDRPQ